jgi:hypothetical protein
VAIRFHLETITDAQIALGYSAMLEALISVHDVKTIWRLPLR